MNNITTCGVCIYSENENPESCSVCLKHLCKSISKNRSVCSYCLINCQKTNCLQKDEIGRYLDPAKRIPLPTCTCGLVLYPMSTCYFDMMSGKIGHRILK